MSCCNQPIYLKLSAIVASLQKRDPGDSSPMLRKTGSSSNSFAKRKSSPLVNLSEQFVNLRENFQDEHRDHKTIVAPKYLSFDEDTVVVSYLIKGTDVNLVYSSSTSNKSDFT